jgi:chromosome partitioning protein
VIVVGNEKGGSGKTTLAMHVAIGLLKAGQRVGTLDLDTDQRSLTCYLENRRVWANHRRIDLELPLHRSISPAQGIRADDNEARELASLQEAIAAFEATCDFLVIDTPSHDGYLMRLAHLVADTVLTPLQDSFLDLCPLGLVDPLTHEITRTGHYAAAVCAARKRRRQLDPGFCDWIVIRNRACEGSLVAASLAELGLQIGFRDAEGCAERAVYRQFFPLGLSAFDTLDERTLGVAPTQSHAAAQSEVRALLDRLQLPMGERGLRRAAARSEWLARRQAPLALDDIFEDGAALRAEELT